MDHNTDKTIKIIPTATLDIEIPDDIKKSWVNDQIYFLLHNNITEPSTALMHCLLEIHLLLQDSAFLTKDETLAMLIHFTDGGGI